MHRSTEPNRTVLSELDIYINYIYQYIHQVYIAIYTSIAYIEILYNTLRGGEFPARARSLLQDDMRTTLRALDQEHDTLQYIHFVGH